MLGCFLGFLDWTPHHGPGMVHARPRPELQRCTMLLLCSMDDAIVSTEPQAFLAFLNNHRVPKHVGSQRKASVDR